MKTRKWLFLCILLVSGEVWGQDCSYNISPTMDFGTIIGLPTPQIDVTADVTVDCPPIFPPIFLYRVCIGMPVGSGGNTFVDRPLVGAGFDVPFNIYRDASRTQVWGSVAGNQHLQFSLGSSGTATATAYGRVFAGASGVSVGTYQSVLNGIEVRDGAYFFLSPPPSCSSLGAAILPGSMTAQLIIEPDCTITANPLDFGTVTNIVQTDASTNLSVDCTLNGAYDISLDGGTTTGDINNRQMQLGAATIDYQLYRDSARTQVWGETAGTNTVAGTGTGAAQSIPVHGRVSAQGPKPVGTYQDTITATVVF